LAVAGEAGPIDDEVAKAHPHTSRADRGIPAITRDPAAHLETRQNS